MFASQPSCRGFMLQSRNEPEHTMLQAPPTQLAAPFAWLHAAPQPPQLLASVPVFCSQPLFGLPSQSVKPLEQLGAHSSPTHAVVPFMFVHTTPQPPQFEVVFSGTSQPFAAERSQSAKPELQPVSTHAPPWHVPLPFGNEHTWPQPPQFSGSLLMSVSQPSLGFASQSRKPVAQMGAHTPIEQLVVPCMFVHPLPHEPQLSMSVCVLTSQPVE